MQHTMGRSRQGSGRSLLPYLSSVAQLARQFALSHRSIWLWFAVGLGLGVWTGETGLKRL